MAVFKIAVVTGCAGLAMLAGCKSFKDYQEDRVAYAVKHFERAQYSNLAPDAVLSLDQCVRMAVKNNLDMKVFELEELVAKEMRTSEVLGMLPELNVSDNFAGRNNTPASSSQQVNGQVGPGTYTYSQSQDRNINYLNVDLALSVLDFGLAFFNTQQANDRMLLRQQRTRRAEQNLVLDTVRVYFQVAASQRAINITAKLLEDCKNRYQLIEKMGETGQITPFRAFDEVRRFIEMEKRLTNYIRSYDNSCVELRSLLGFYPNTQIKVDDSILDKVPEFTFPEMTLMEQIALMKRPELFEIDMQKHINVIECRKTILMMFPNVRIFLDFTNSNNSFLYHSTWYELGVRAAYNLLKLPQHIARYQAYSSQVDTEEARSYAQAIAVMAQVRIAHANLIAVKERFDIDSKVNTAYSKNLKKAEASGKISGELSQLELAHMRLATTETEIEKFLSLGNYYVAYYRVLNTLGIENLHSHRVQDLKVQLADARVKAEDELKKAKADYDAEQVKIKQAEKELKTPVLPPTEPTGKNPVKPADSPAAKTSEKTPAVKPVAKAVRIQSVEFADSKLADRLMGELN